MGDELTVVREVIRNLAASCKLMMDTLARLENQLGEMSQLSGRLDQTADMAAAVLRQQWEQHTRG